MNATVLIVGAGMTGIGAGYYLGRSDISYLILEAKDELGGVWQSHRWHGARCDSDFIKYSFSFKPFLSDECLQPAARIKAYLRDVAQEFGILERIRFGTQVIKAVFDEDTASWYVHTTRGVFTARFLMNGNGYFSDEPYVPAIKDAAEFRGEVVHTSRLDAKRTFRDKKVVVVGSGSTAVCCAPELARVSKSLVLLQRSPSYIYEIDNKADALVRLCQSLYRCGMHAAVTWLRSYLQLRDDFVFLGFRAFPRLARAFFRRHWVKAVGEATFRAHFTPRYNPWEQRIAVAIGFKDRLRSGEMQMMTGEIDRFTASGLVLKSGEHLECDVCVLATGLNLRFFSFDLYRGSQKIAVERINFYKGLMVGGIPNYFHPMGSWHSAWTQRAEPLTRLAIRIMRYMERRGHRSVVADRQDLPSAPGITPNYVLRALGTMPRLQGTTDLPSIDNALACLFNLRRLRFSGYR
jgi:cation diffusion facilitator CzcD-associated flavoprotein CzcO